MALSTASCVLPSAGAGMLRMTGTSIMMWAGGFGAGFFRAVFLVAGLRLAGIRLSSVEGGGWGVVGGGFLGSAAGVDGRCFVVSSGGVEAVECEKPDEGVAVPAELDDRGRGEGFAGFKLIDECLGGRAEEMAQAALDIGRHGVCLRIRESKNNQSKNPE